MFSLTSSIVDSNTVTIIRISKQRHCFCIISCQNTNLIWTWCHDRVNQPTYAFWYQKQQCHGCQKPRRRHASQCRLNPIPWGMRQSAGVMAGWVSLKTPDSNTYEENVKRQCPGVSISRRRAAFIKRLICIQLDLTSVALRMRKFWTPKQPLYRMTKLRGSEFSFI